jgi:hypothetical protein
VVVVVVLAVVVVGGAVVVVVVLGAAAACDVGDERVARTAIATPPAPTATASATTMARRDRTRRDGMTFSAPVSANGAALTS